MRYLSDLEISRLVNASAPDLRQIVIAGVLTGLRYGEICRLRGLDFDPMAATLMVAISKSGKPRHVHLTDEGCAFFKQAVAGKSSNVLVFVRASGEPWGKSHQFRLLREACAAGQIEPAISIYMVTSPSVV